MLKCSGSAVKIKAGGDNCRRMTGKKAVLHLKIIFSHRVLSYGSDSLCIYADFSQSDSFFEASSMHCE